MSERDIKVTLTEETFTVNLTGGIGIKGDTGNPVFPRVLTITSDSEPTINTDTYDAVSITALATDIISMTTNLSGTHSNFQKLLFRIYDDGTSRNINWGTGFNSMGVELPTVTTATKILIVGFIYDSVTSKWGCVAVATN